ncbi:hypothetical protein JAAARDRAFT_192365 [Jaapia argillacea MUCL 33604]|uniref:Uncharacterized protein n=1 Tax=Jaapia argillacea MUCL 33604 TaxID=933084 RepID=A0A067Q8T8_9AGAM|nr:hypothetical protein JAAARDRAFT_192365 [Jaapia argillacea MUCL 33604]
MSRSILFVALLLSSLFALSSARCIGCPNCDYDNTGNGNECLSGWTCDGTSMTMGCYYPSSTDPGTYNLCTYAIDEEGGYLVSGSSVCDSTGGIDSKCELSDGGDVYSWGPPGYCIAASWGTY